MDAERPGGLNTVHGAPNPAAWIFIGPHGVRAGWRIVLYTVFFLGLWSVLATVGAAFGVPGDLMDEAAYVFGLIAALVAGWAMLVILDRRRPGALGFALDPAAGRDSAVGFGLGAGFLIAAVAALAVAGSARWVADGGTTAEYVATLASALLLFAVPAALEEAMFRGYAFQALVQGVGAWPAIIASSALFSALHAGNPNVDALALANIFLAGIMLAVAYLRTRSLWFATALHLGWNWAMSALLDFPVSGLVRDTPLYSAQELGADWWTGGPFGPEAGVAATLAVVGGTVLLLRMRSLRESPRMRALRPLVDDRVGERWPHPGPSARGESSGTLPAGERRLAREDLR